MRLQARAATVAAVGAAFAAGTLVGVPAGSAGQSHERGKCKQDWHRVGSSKHLIETPAFTKDDGTEWYFAGKQRIFIQKKCRDHRVRYKHITWAERTTDDVAN